MHISIPITHTQIHGEGYDDQQEIPNENNDPAIIGNCFNNVEI